MIQPNGNVNGAPMDAEEVMEKLRKIQQTATSDCLRVKMRDEKNAGQIYLTETRWSEEYWFNKQRTTFGCAYNSAISLQ